MGRGSDLRIVLDVDLVLDLVEATSRAPVTRYGLVLPGLSFVFSFPPVSNFPSP